MEAFLKILPVIVIVLAIFVVKEGYSMYRYARLCRLHEASRSGRIEKVREYLQAGHPVNGLDPRFGLTPLHYAVRNGHVKIARLLIRNGAGLDDRSAQGISAAQWASEYLSVDELEDLQQLSDEL
jgi:ankyrin repeat protein